MSNFLFLVTLSFSVFARQMLKYKVYLLTLIAISNYSYCQSTCGYVTDKNTGEKLSGANIRSLTTRNGTSTDGNGFFCISSDQRQPWVVSMIGYVNDTIYCCSSGTAGVNIELISVVYDLHEVEIIQSFAERNFSQGLTRLNASDLRNIPAMGGERDLLKAVTILPGVSAGIEGFSGISVRGGNTEHNLIILDGTPIYNSGHMFNIFSLFNPDAIKDVTLYKNAFPARYGGRLASVMEVNFHDGNNKTTEFAADLGIINSKLSVQGPVGTNGQTTYFFSTRSTYFDLFKNKTLKRIKEAEPSTEHEFLNDFGYTFSDINLKINHRFNDRNWMFFSGYYGLDYYRVYDYSRNNKSMMYLRNTNLLGSIKSHHFLGESTFIELIGSFNSYESKKEENENRLNIYFVSEPYLMEVIQPLSEFKLETQNSIKDLSSEAHLTHKFNNGGTLKSGLTFTQHGYAPTSYYQQEKEVDSPLQEWNVENSHLFAYETSAYAGYETRWLNCIDLYVGLRTSLFSNQGFFNPIPEPRLSIGYNTESSGVFNFSYASMRQFNHALVRNEQLIQNIVWVPSTDNIEPQQSQQYSVGYMKMMMKGAWQLETNIYYKEMEHLVYYNKLIDEPFFFNNWEDYLLGGGKGRGHGAEFSLTRLKGIVTGNANYSWSSHHRKFNELNNGKWFNYKFNRTHEFNLTGNTRLSQRWKMGFYWTISSGSWISLPDGYVEDTPYNYGYFSYSSINNAQLPVYHRLDLSFDWSKRLKNNHLFGFSFNIYNAYYRKNSSYIFIGTQTEFDDMHNIINEKPVIKSVSHMPLIPSFNVSYRM